MAHSSLRAPLASVALLAFSAQAADTIRYLMLFQGRESGAQETTELGGGRVGVKFSYRDNGRGPDYAETLALAADGTLDEFEINGRSTYGAPVAEHFVRDGGRASWTTLADRGKSDQAEAAFYLPLDSSSESLARLIAAALRHGDRHLALLPSGSARVDSVKSLEIEGSELGLYAVHGIGTEPALLWLDARQRLAADIEPGFYQLVREDLRGSAGALEKVQEEVERVELARRAALAHRLPNTLLLRNVRVFDSEHARLGEASDVYIQEGRFSAIYPTGSKAMAVDAVIEGGGRVLLPGLFDMHDHIDPWTAPLHLAAGVTTARDMGGENLPLAQLRRDFAAGVLLGPRLITAGFIEGESPFSSRSGFVIKNLDEARDAVDWYAQHGFPQLKVYNSFPREILADTVEYAHRRGLRVSGHVPAFLRAEEVIAMGFDEIQHINQLLLNFLVKPTDDTRTLLRFDLVAEKAGDLDFGSKAVREFIASMKQHGVVADPTLATFESFRQLQGSMHPGFAAIADHLPPSLNRSLHSNSTDVNPSNIERNRRSYAKMVAFVGLLHEAGVDLVAGTDDISGFTLHRELELYVEAGIAPTAALRIATWNGAKFTRTLDRLGSIAPGKLADAVLVDGDPTLDIAAIRKPVLVLSAGNAYRPDEIYQALSIKPFVASLPVPVPTATP